MTKLSKQTKDLLIADAKCGFSLGKLASKYGISRGAVQKIKKLENIKEKNFSIGRPRILTCADQRLIVRKIKDGTYETATDVVKNNVDINVSPQTIRRVLRRGGLKAVTKVKKPFLSKRYKQLRFQFAVAHKDWTSQDWYKVIFSDETKVNRFWSDGRKWCWKNPGAVVDDRNVQGTAKFGGGSLMVWGCITAEGPGYLTRIDGNMDAQLYCDILGDELLNTCEYYGLDTDKIIFQQDNDPKHTSKKAKDWFLNNNIDVLSWPPQSPDINPIENIWSSLKLKLNRYENLPSGILELWDRVSKEWNDISKTECRNVIESMPKRIRALLKAKGAYTNY